MATRWVINFGTLDKSCSISIEDSSYSGAVIQLTPANNPLTLSRRQTDFFQPILSESGLISIIDTGDSSQHIEDIHPQNAFARPVTIYYDGQLYWRGYLSPEALTVDYGPAPRIVSFPLVGALSVLSSVNMTGDETAPKSIAYYLYYCLQQTGYNWSNIHFPPRLYSIVDADSPHGSYGIPELRLCVSIYNFYDKNDASNVNEAGYTQLIGVSLEDCLKTICQFFGWTIIADGYDIYLTNCYLETAQSIDPIDLTMSDLFKIAVDPMDYSINPYFGNIDRPLIEFTSLSWSGLNHRRTINNGLKRITLTHNNRTNDNCYPQLNYKGDVDAHDGFDMPLELLYQQYHLLTSIDFLDPSKEINLELYSYRYNDNTQSFDRIDWAPWSNPGSGTYSGDSTPRADIVRGKTLVYYSYQGTSYKIHSVDEQNYLRLCRARNSYASSSARQVLSWTQPLAKISALTTCYFPQGGALCLSALVRNNLVSNYNGVEFVDREGLSQWGPFCGYLHVAIKIGNMYFNGTGWQNSEMNLAIQVVSAVSGGDSSQSNCEDGKIKNTNEDHNYNDAQGYIIPITEDLYGKLELIFYPWTQNPNVDTLFLKDIKIEYFNGLMAENKPTDINLLSALTGADFVNSRTTTLSITSSKGPILTPSLLFWNGHPVGNKDIFWPFPDGSLYSMPEQILLKTMKTVFSKPSNWLTLETTFDKSIKMWSLVKNNNPDNPDNKIYVIVGMDTDFADNTTKLYLATYQ